MSDFLVSLHENGTIKSAGPIDDGYVPDEDLEGDAAVDDKDEPVPDEQPKVEEKKAAKALVKAEEKSEGRISKRAMFSFFR
jgi:hypothetical protein